MKIAAFAVFALFIAASWKSEAEVPSGKVVAETAHFKALDGNLLGDSADRQFAVYLPPSYRQGRKHYPVIYLLHGFSSTYKMWTDDPQAGNVPAIMDRLISEGRVREMIIVMVDGWNKLGGSFYTNSITAGNWEDYVTFELVAYIDAKYRTQARSSSRGIAGHSMGGYGAVKLAMKHPDVFGAMYALSACCLDADSAWSPNSPVWQKILAVKTMDDALGLQTTAAAADRKDPQWLLGFLSVALVAQSAAFSANPANPPVFVDYPVERRGDILVVAEKPLAEWTANLPIAMLGQYRTNLLRLRGIGFEIGKQDWNPSLIRQARDFDAALDLNGIHHEFAEFTGSHKDKLGERIAAKALPFFSRVLE
jgi:S-formylglutathione hydrolase